MVELNKKDARGTQCQL